VITHISERVTPAGAVQVSNLHLEWHLFDRARRTVNGSGYKMEGPPGLGISPNGACIS
jgi:hypothetical protein